MNSFESKRSRVKIPLVLLFGLLTLARTSLVGGIVILPIDLELSYTNGRPLSADGLTIAGSTTGGAYCVWTQSGGKVTIPVPQSGIRCETVSHLNFNGTVIAGSGIRKESFGGTAWTWRPGVGLRAYSPPGMETMDNIGVSPDGSFTIRRYETGSQSIVHRDYSLGDSPVWITTASNNVCGASEDGTRLIGHAVYPGQTLAIPCYWTSAGQVVYGLPFLGQPQCDPLLSNKDGTIIVGTLYTSTQIPGYGPVTKTFRWNTGTNEVDYYLPAGFLETEPDCVSADGNIFALYGWLDPYHSKSLLLDTTNPTEAAKGFQDVSTWLVQHQYLASADLENRSNFSILGLSDDNSTAVGAFTKSDGTLGYYLAHR